VRGDLDWITMKTLEKDRRRRYETVNGLAADIERYLRDETGDSASAQRDFTGFKKWLTGIGSHSRLARP